MRYLVAVDYHFLDAPGGAPRVAYDIAQLAKDAGHDVAMICYHPNATHDDLCTQDGMQVLRVGHTSLPKWDPRRTFSSIQNVQQAVRRFFGKQSWDRLHIHSIMTGLGASLALNSRTHRCLTLHSPVSLEYAAHEPSDLFQRAKHLLGVPLLVWMERKLLYQSQHIHVLSRFSARYIEQTYPSLAERVDVIPYWRQAALKRTHTKEAARAALGWDLNKVIFFTVRNHIARTGIGDAIEAVHPLAKAGRCELMIAGDGPLRSAYQQRVVEAGLEQDIRFLGRISDQALHLAYQAADAFLVPTRALECFGLILIEAMAFGCPVISSDSSAIPEVMNPILPQYVYPAGNVPALTKKLTQFLNKELPLPSADQITQYVEDTYGPQRVIPMYLKWLLA
ncbi:glycosyltransferase family 4 protein [Myxococcota bacterium]|nr:glycosyltransferase family 4 protein [Myxococcota bacterium]